MRTCSTLHTIGTMSSRWKGGKDGRLKCCKYCWRTTTITTYLQFGVDCVKTTDQMLQKEFEGLRKAEEVLALSVGREEGGNASTSVVDETTLVGGHVLRLWMRRVTTGGRAM